MTEAGSTPTGPRGRAGRRGRRRAGRCHLAGTSRGWRLRSPWSCLGIAAVVSGSAIGGRATDPDEASAKAAAEQLLRTVHATARRPRPSRVGKLRDAPAVPATPDEFDLHHSWTGGHVAGRGARPGCTATRRRASRNRAAATAAWGRSPPGRSTTAHRSGTPPCPGDLWVAVVDAPAGGSELRADAVTTWTPTRPAGATIPARRQPRRRGPHPADGPDAPQPVHHLTVTDAREVAALRSAVNALPRARRGAFSCPLDRGESYDLSFRRGSGGQAPVATVHAQMDGCRGVVLHVAGQSEIALAGSERLHALLARLDP